MASYRVYKVGEDEHVRVADVAAPSPLRRDGAGRDRRAKPARRWVWGLIAAAAAVAALVYWFYGREAVSNSRAALDILKKLDKVPEWAVLGAPVVVVAAVALVTAYLAFGRHLAVKIVGVAVVVLVLATPGLAVGYANGLVSGVGGSNVGSAAKTDAEAKQIEDADREIVPALPNKPMNILLIGSDKSSIPGDPGRSDTQMLVRLDPETKSISMLSLPRDLYVEIPDYGYEKMNSAYSYGGPKLVIKTFKSLTGLPINGWIEVNFAGFWHVVNILGGVYLPIDHKYFVPASADYKSINLEPGYQLVRGKQALNYVRFRHDEFFDFGRMQRQQLFLKELQRQSGRWSSDWRKVIKLIRAITGETKSSLSSLAKVKPLVELAFEVNTSKVYQAHLEGANTMINGASVVEATPQEIADVVHQFTNPTQAPVTTKGQKVKKDDFQVHIYNGSGIDGLATSAASQLAAQGYNTTAEADAYDFPGKTTVVYAPRSLESYANLIASMLAPASVQIVERAPGTVDDGITAIVASSFSGTIDVPQEVVQEQQTLEKNVKADWSTWKEYDAKTPLKLEAPTAWSSGFTYDQWRNYSIETTEGKRSAASVAVVKTAQYGYWCVQAMRWQNPPAIQNPNSTQTIKGRKYLLFYQGDHLHMVAWRAHATLYWVINTLTNQLSNDVMMGLATSCKPVK
jgi:LCP family protein required for cell wall assembly